MIAFPNDLLYSSGHQYVRVLADPSIVEIGITDFAQSELGDVVYVQLPSIGTRLTRNERFGVLESYKANPELRAPLSGEVLEINLRLNDDPALVNRDPYGAGWLIRLRTRRADERARLLEVDAYKGLIGWNDAAKALENAPPLPSDLG